MERESRPRSAKCSTSLELFRRAIGLRHKRSSDGVAHALARRFSSDVSRRSVSQILYRGVKRQRLCQLRRTQELFSKLPARGYWKDDQTLPGAAFVAGEVDPQHRVLRTPAGQKAIDDRILVAGAVHLRDVLPAQEGFGIGSDCDPAREIVRISVSQANETHAAPGDRGERLGNAGKPVVLDVDLKIAVRGPIEVDGAWVEAAKAGRAARK